MAEEAEASSTGWRAIGALSRGHRYAGYRLLIGLGVLSSTVLYAVLSGQPIVQLVPYFEVSGLTLLVFLAQLAWYSRQSPTRRSLWVQVCIDVALVSWLVALTGGLTSLGAFLYFPTIVAAPFLLPGPSALWTAGISTLGCVIAGAIGGPGSPLLLAYELALRVLAFFLVGMIMDSYVRRFRRLEEEHSTVLDQVRAGVVATDQAGIIRSLNPAAEGMLGEVLGRPLASVLPAMGERTTWEESRGPVTFVCSRARLPDGGIVLLDDVTELYRMREQSAREERLAAVGRLAASVAHEIRNPLASLSGCLQMLAEDPGNQLAALALNEAGRLNRLVEDFLQTARAPVLRPMPTGLEQLIREAIRAFEADPRFRGQVQIRASLDPVRIQIDPDRIRQVLWNLLSNAAQAMPAGGTIHIELRDSTMIEGFQMGVHLRVRDEGVGVPAEDLNRIFDPFFTTRSGGTGLGLSLVDQIIRGHGGHVTASRLPERGMEFHIWLPHEHQWDPSDQHPDVHPDMQTNQEAFHGR